MLSQKNFFFKKIQLFMGRGRRWAFEWLTQWTVKLDTDFEAVEAEEAKGLFVEVNFIFLISCK